jgi:hypothetical protein
MWSKYDAHRIEERRRNESLSSKRHEHAMRRYEADLADQEQLGIERKERWELEKKEREIRLAHRSWRERIEIGAGLMWLAFTILLLFAGIRSEQFVLGGSGVVSLFSVSWMLRSSLGGRRESAA